MSVDSQSRNADAVRVDKNLTRKFGVVLRELRREAGLTQRDLVFECGLDRTFVSLLERGLRQPSLTTLFVLAAALNVSPADIVESL